MKDLKIINQLHFDIVNGCQLECVGCPSPIVTKKINYIEPSVLKNCLNNIDVDRVKVFRLFNYGEPLLHPNLTKIGKVIGEIEHIQFNVIEISTNAQKVNWEDFKNLMKLGVITRIAVSCDGNGTASSYEELRPPAKWSKLLEFFEKCSQIVKEYSPDTILITRSTINALSDMDKWKEVLSPYGFEPEFRGWKQLPQATNMTERENIPAKSICFFVEDMDQLYVNADGDVVPCCAHPKAGYFGNLKGQTYTEIQNSNERKLFVDRLLKERYNVAICNTCEFGSKEDRGMSAGQNLPTT